MVRVQLQNHSGVWMWASDKPELHEAVKSYFGTRKEDRPVRPHPRGNTPHSPPAVIHLTPLAPPDDVLGAPVVLTRGGCKGGILTNQRCRC